MRMLDFAIRAACLATTTEHVLEGRLLYRPDFCLITFARELSLLRSIDVATLDKWSLWDWNVKRVTHLCGAELVKDGVVDAKGVFTSMIKGMLRGKDQLCLSKEEITSMRLQLEDLENLQDLARGSLASPCYAEYREWQMRALEEYFLWVTEVRGHGEHALLIPLYLRLCLHASTHDWFALFALFKFAPSPLQRGRTKKNNCVPSSAAAQRDAMEWYKTCSEAYAVSVTLALRDRQEVPNNYWVPMAAAVYSKVRPRPVIL